MKMLELDFEARALSSGQGSAPVIYMSHSDDGGHTWTTPRAATAGAIGQWRWRAIWPTMGSYTQRMIAFRINEPIFAAFLGCWAHISLSR
jgi:hypothetical protein